MSFKDHSLIAKTVFNGDKGAKAQRETNQVGVFASLPI